MTYQLLTFPLFLLFSVFHNETHAQMDADRLDTLSPAVEAAQELERVEKLLLLGPHRKNPNAAGRMLILRARDYRVAPLPTRNQLFGPAYKNRRATVLSSDTLLTPAPTRERLMGPRYKNRGAKSRRQ